jgi:hypothetical protein
MRAIGTATGHGRTSQAGRLGPGKAARIVHLVCAEACWVIFGQVWALKLGGEA